MSALAYLLGFFLLSAGQAQFFGRAGPRSPQGNRRGREFQIPVPGGYLPPEPVDPVCMPTTNYVTETDVKTEVVTSYTVGSGGGVSTSVVYVSKVQPTTKYDVDVSTRYSTTVQTTTRTSTQRSTSTYVTTIGGIPVTRTSVSTVIVPRTVTSTSYSTISSTAYVTITTTVRDETTIVQPVTTSIVVDKVDLSTYYRQEPDTTRTNVITSTVISTIQTQPPPSTFYQTRTIQSTEGTTTTIQGPPVQVTRTQSSTQLEERTSTTTFTDVTTQTEVYPSVTTIISTAYSVSTSTITTTYVNTQVSRVVVTSTQVTTQYFPTTIYDHRVVTITETPPPVIRTSTTQLVVTESASDKVNTVTSTQYSTKYTQVTSTVSVGGGQQTVTETVREACGTTGYNYPAPSVAFNF